MHKVKGKRRNDVTRTKEVIINFISLDRQESITIEIGLPSRRNYFFPRRSLRRWKCACTLRTLVRACVSEQTLSTDLSREIARLRPNYKLKRRLSRAEFPVT